MSWERLEVEMSNLACRFITSGANDWNAKLGQRGWEGVAFYWACGDETVHYKYNETVNFAALDVQLRRL